MAEVVAVVIGSQCMDIERTQAGEVLLYARLRQWARSLHFKISEKGLGGEERNARQDSVRVGGWNMNVNGTCSSLVDIEG